MVLPACTARPINCLKKKNLASLSVSELEENGGKKPIAYSLTRWSKVDMDIERERTRINDDLSHHEQIISSGGEGQSSRDGIHHSRTMLYM
jgi:hypothetical protein